MTKVVTLLIALLASGPVLADAQETNAVEKVDLQSFRVISQRNIFNPNRSSRGDRSERRRDPERRVRTESFALLGTMNYDKGWFAFFDGSSSEYRRAAQ